MSSAGIRGIGVRPGAARGGVQADAPLPLQQSQRLQRIAPGGVQRRPGLLLGDTRIPAQSPDVLLRHDHGRTPSRFDSLVYHARRPRVL